MTLSAEIEPACGLGLDRARLIEANINPITGLATDYLNHFNEAIMMLELAVQVPQCVDDFCAWRPLSYCENFAISTFRERDLAIAVYGQADPALRRRLDELADGMNAILLSTAAALRAQPQGLGGLAQDALMRLRPLVARAGAVIHGAEPAADEAAEAQADQAAVDA